ncbi:MAG: glycoside hydrolase family 3 N-terminal domain-containing protein [Polyangiales bacterium]
MRLSRWVLLALVGCGGGSAAPDASGVDGGVDGGVDATVGYEPARFTPTAATRSYCRGADDDAVEARITDLLRALPVDEKVRLLAGAGVVAMDRSWRVPGIESLRVPGLRMLDGPRGLSAVTRAPATVFPVAMARGCAWDPSLERRVGEAIAEEVRSVGADVLLAPTMNVLRHPRWGRAQETYGEDPTHLGEMAVAFIEGAQSRGVLASAKHYAANSIENTRHSVDVRMDERTLREVYLPHFRRAVVEARVASVMTAYNRVNGAWADQSTHLLRDILKGEWGFAGFVESDWILGTHGASSSVRAGLDLEMPSPLNFRRLPAEIAAGMLTVRELDDSVRRVLRAQFCYGLDARPFVADDPGRRGTAAHRALAREAARAGLVLLRNERVGERPALPFGPEVRRLAVLGRNADVENLGDRGSSNVVAAEVVTALEGLRTRAGVTVTHVTTLDDAGEAAVREADAVVVVTGLQADDEGEGEIGAGDRASLALRESEIARIRGAAALNPRVVVVLQAGAAVTVDPWNDEVEAVLFTGYPGEEGGHALAEVLFGEASPAGRLPFVIPVREADLGDFDNTSPTVTYGYLHGYRLLASRGVRARYDFGHGLTYTRFAHRDVRASTGEVTLGGVVEVSVEVRNEGAARGVDVVQVYASAEGATVLRAPRDLRGFARVELDPGESRRVTVTVRGADLARWDEAGARWVLDPGRYTLRVGAHATDEGVTTVVTAR